MCISIQSFAFNPIFILRTIFLQLDDFFIYCSPLSLFECHFLLLFFLPSPSSSTSSSSSYSITRSCFFFYFYLHSLPCSFLLSPLSLLNWCQKISPMIRTFRMICFIFTRSICTMGRAKIALLFSDIWANVHCWSGKYTKPIYICPVFS